jgi:hypothetical protein
MRSSKPASNIAKSQRPHPHRNDGCDGSVDSEYLGWQQVSERVVLLPELLLVLGVVIEPERPSRVIL